MTTRSWRTRRYLTELAAVALAVVLVMVPLALAVPRGTAVEGELASYGVAARWVECGGKRYDEPRLAWGVAPQVEADLRQWTVLVPDRMRGNGRAALEREVSHGFATLVAAAETAELAGGERQAAIRRLVVEVEGCMTIGWAREQKRAVVSGG